MSSVGLIWVTPDAEKMIVQMARVSSPENATNVETSERLLKYLISHKHWSPFEMANMCVKINTERDIAAQIIRHRSISFQEYSTRYSEAQEINLPSFRRQDYKNRQNSFNDLDDSITTKFITRSNLQARTAEETQQEHRTIADTIKMIFIGQFPVIASAAFKKN